MMKAWKKKLYREQKEDNNDAKKSLRVTNDVKQRRSAASTIDTNRTSCLKKPEYDTDGSVSDGQNSKFDALEFSKGSSNLGSIAGRTATTCGDSPISKKVRFDVVEIRQYERIASDNPCCSSGPPIGIGWNHGEIHRTNVNDYEQSRGGRNFNLDIVLTRSRREALLSEWDVDTRTIVASTRAAMKTKFQRKQTVINARKFSKLEEVMESTSRRLRKVLLPRRRIDDGADESLEVTPSQIFELDHSRGGETISTSSADEDNKSHIHATEPDEDLIEKLMKNSFDIPTVGICNEGDDNASNCDEFTLGATTLGNTSTYSPSITEMEIFYRELELEMFGEEIELPSMVGQTLEVPLDAKRNSTNLNTSSSGGAVIQDEMSFDGNSCSNPQSAHVEKYPSRSFPDESHSDSYDNRALSDDQGSSYTYDAPNTSTRTRIYQHQFIENHYDQPPFTQDASPTLDAVYQRTHSIINNPHREHNDSMNHSVPLDPTAQRQTMSVSQSGLDPHYTQYRGYHEPINSQRDNYRHHHRRRNGSFDSYCNIAPKPNNIQYSSPASRLQQNAQSHFQPQYLPTASSLDTADFSFRYSDPGGHIAQRSFPQSRDSHFDGPQVRHMPLHGHLSANQWMDEADRKRSYCNNTTVTITEHDP